MTAAINFWAEIGLAADLCAKGDVGHLQAPGCSSYLNRFTKKVSPTSTPYQPGRHLVARQSRGVFDVDHIHNVGGGYPVTKHRAHRQYQYTNYPKHSSQPSGSIRARIKRPALKAQQ